MIAEPLLSKKSFSLIDMKAHARLKTDQRTIELVLGIKRLDANNPTIVIKIIPA